MGKKQKYIIWAGTVILLAMLVCIYVAIDRIYGEAAPHIPADYIASALTH